MRHVNRSFKSKIHRVTVTASDLNYIGSITVDEDLIDAAGLVVGERVYIVNVNNGERFDTYVIKGKRKSGEFVSTGPKPLEKCKRDNHHYFLCANVCRGSTKPKKLFSQTKNQSFLLNRYSLENQKNHRLLKQFLRY